MTANPEMSRDRPARDHLAGPVAGGLQRVSGRHLCTGIALSAALAGVLAIAITVIARRG